MVWKDWKETAVKKARERIVLGVFALITLLLLVIWRAVPSSVWDTVSEATPKRVLWALLGLEAITICVLTALLVDYKRSRSDAPDTVASQPVQSLPPKPIRRFGVHWDEDQNPLCPVCETLLFLTGGTIQTPRGTKEVLRCAKCPHDYSLRNDLGHHVSLIGAKQDLLLRPPKNKFQISD